MPRDARSSKVWQRATEECQQRVLLAVSLAIDTYPKQLSPATIKMIGDDALIGTINAHLKRFASYVEEELAPRRRRKASDSNAEADEAVQ
jgi:hypothetical protein